MADMEREIFMRIIADLTASNAKLTREVAELTEQVKNLTEALNQKKHKKDSHNSSQPPSSDGYSKPTPKSLRKSSGKMQGGQEGHKGKGMAITREPDEIKTFIPECCKGCPNAEKCASNYKCAETHYTYDIEVITKLIAYKIYACECPLRENEEVTGEFPPEARGTKQYGTNIRAFIVALVTLGYVSVNRTKQIIEGLGIPISGGTIQNMLHRCAEKLKDPVNRIRDKVAQLKVIHCDETGADVNGKLHWIHCLCDSKWSYCRIHEKRGSKAMEEIGILPNLDNCTLIHDFWAAYLSYVNVKHGFCNTHLERELIYAFEVTNQSWADKMNALLSEMCGKRNALKEKGYSAFAEEDLEEYYSRYDKYLEEGAQLNPITPNAEGKRGRTAKGKTRCLIDRMTVYREDILRFTVDWDVPFTNNEAERCVRFAKVKEKVSGCFRTIAGAEDFMSITSYIGTAKKHNVSVYEALQSAFSGTAMQLVESWD